LGTSLDGLLFDDRTTHFWLKIQKANLDLNARSTFNCARIYYRSTTYQTRTGSFTC